MTPARFFDGVHARSAAVVVSLAAREEVKGLVIAGDDVDQHWPLSDLREVRDQAAAGIVLSLGQDGAERLLIDDLVMAAALRAQAPNLDSRRIGRGMGRRLAVWGTGAVASVLVILLVILPAMADTLATFIPRDREVAIGRASLNQISRALGGSRESLTCNGAEGRAALDKMTARLLGDRTLDYDLDVQVFRHKAVNAFAVPGGHVVLFDGLLQAAGSPEEVAGVLGHEIGHVINRDPTRLTLRSAGSVGILGLLFGDFAGGAAVIVVTERLMAASYAQDAERGADRVAHDLLAQAGLPSQPLALFFIKLRDRYGERGGLLSHLASHPDLGSRADAARAADRVGDVPYVPVLSDREWAALKSICAG